MELDSNNPNVRLCSRQKCDGGLVDLLANPPVCRKCGKTFCKQCELEAHHGPCEKVFQEMFNDWKRCPKCKVFIQRTQGCNHMTCTCGHQFCYVCLQNWQMRHYSCGGAQQLYIFQQFQVPQSRCERLLLIFIYLFALPLLILVTLLIMPFAMAIFGIGGFLVLPLVIVCNSNISCIGNQICCPYLAVAGLIVGAFCGIYLLCSLLFCPKFRLLCSRLSQLCESFFG